MSEIKTNGTPKIGVYVCHCGLNIAQSVAIDAFESQSLHGHRSCDRALGPHLRIVTDALEQPVRNARRPARPLGDLFDAGRVDRRPHDARRAGDNLFHRRKVVKVEAIHGAKPVAQWRAEHGIARRRADNRKVRQSQAN